MGEFVGKRVVPDHVGVWDQKKTYEPLMIVLDGETGDSYISRKAVPIGISLSDESYWSLCAHYSAQMRKLEQDVDVDVQQMHSDVTAVKNAMSQEFQETHKAKYIYKIRTFLLTFSVQSVIINKLIRDSPVDRV